MNNITQKISYEYRLNANSEHQVSSIDQIKLTTEWKSFNKIQDKLTKRIRTKLNSPAVIDYREVDQKTKKIINSSVINYLTKTPNYTHKELSFMERSEIEGIARYFLINPINKRNEHLVTLIKEEQEKYLGVTVSV